MQAVGGASFSLAAGEVLCLLGESGSGKSVTLRALMRLLPPRAQVEGRVALGGRDVLSLGGRALRDFRGGDVAMVFQEPMTALDPVYTIGQHLSEMIRRHKGGSRARRPRARDRAAGPGEDPLRRAPRGRVSARALGRAAAARHDRAGAELRPPPAAGRRADHRARRHRAGAGADPAAPPAARDGHGHGAGHARPGRGRRGRGPRRRDVRRPRGGGGAGGRRPVPPRAPLHRGAARLHRARPGAGRGDRRHSRQPAGPATPAARLRLRAALPPGDGGLPRRPAPARAPRARPHGALPARRRRAGCPRPGCGPGRVRPEGVRIGRLRIGHLRVGRPRLGRPQVGRPRVGRPGAGVPEMAGPVGPPFAPSSAGPRPASPGEGP